MPEVPDLASQLEEGFFPLSKEVDEVWHELITETLDYQQLCARLPGGRFLRHSSITLAEYAGQREVQAVARELPAWIPRYVHAGAR